jgi:6-phosphogluconolactonase (cycloisomerase 2 family)
VSPSTDIGGSRLLTALAALLALSGCGSGQSSSTNYTQPTSRQPSGRVAYVYVVSAGPNPGSAGVIYEYAVMSDYSVSPLPQASISAGIDPAAVVLAQGYVYVVNVGDGTISQYDIAADHTLTPMNPATVTNPGMHTLGVAPVAATVDPTGSFLYVTNAADDTVSQFSITVGGQLVPLTPSTVATGVDPVAIVDALVPDSTAAYYVVNSGAPGDTGTVSAYSSGENGTLMPLGSDPLAAGTNPTAIAINDISTNVYVMSNCDGADCTGSIRQFAVGSGGALTDTGVIATTGSHYDAVDMAISQPGPNSYAYVLSNATGASTNAGALWQYGVGSTGELTPASPPMLNVDAVAVAQTMQVGLLYVLTANSRANANAGSTGGNINVYGMGGDGAAILLAATKISVPHPVAMGIQALLPP